MLRMDENLNSREIFRLLISMLPFCGLSVFLSVTFVHCAQMVEDVDPTSVAYNSAESLPDLIKLIWLRLHRSTLPQQSLTQSGLI